MLTLQARVTLIAYVILMAAFFIPLKGDMDLLNKFGTSLIMLLPVSLSVYIINCMVTGSKAKLGLGCNAIAWIESLYILIIAVIVLLYNLMNSKKDTIENFYNPLTLPLLTTAPLTLTPTGSCGSDAVYGSAEPYGSCIVTSNTCGSTAGSQAYKEKVLGSGSGSGCQNRITYKPCEIVCGSCSDEGDYGSWSNGSDSCEPVGSGCGSTAGSQSQTRQYKGNNDACNIPENKNRSIGCEIECNNNTGSCGSDAVYGSAESYGSCTQIGSDCGSTAGSQAYIQTASGCEDRTTYQPCNIDCLPNCEYSIATFGSGCIVSGSSCVERVNMEANNGSNCIGSQSYIGYIGCFGSDVCDFGSDDVSQDYQTRSNLYYSLVGNSTGVNPQLIQSLINGITSDQISNLDTDEKQTAFLQLVENSTGSGSTYDITNISDINEIITTAISSLESSNGDANANGDANQSGSGDNILHSFITAIQNYGTSSDSFSYSAEPVGSDSDRYKYCINNVDFGNQDCIIVGPGIIQKD